MDFTVENNNAIDSHHSSITNALRWYNFGITACRDEGPELAHDNVEGTQYTDWAGLNVYADHSMLGVNSLSRFERIDSIGKTVNVFENTGVYGDDAKFKKLGGVITFRKIFAQNANKIDFIRNTSPFFHNDGGTPIQRLLMATNSQESSQVRIPSIYAVKGGVSHEDEIDTKDLITHPIGWGDGQDEFLGHKMSNNPIWNAFGTSYNISIESGSPHPAIQNHSPNGYLHSTWLNNTYNNHSTSLLETCGVGTHTNLTPIENIEDFEQLSQVDWLSDVDSFSTTIGNRLNVFAISPLEDTSDGDKTIGFGVENLNGDKYYIGGWNTETVNGGVLKFEGSGSTDASGSNCLTDNLGSPSTGNNYITTTMVMAGTSGYNSFIDPSDGDECDSDQFLAYTAGTEVDYKVSLVYDGANESTLDGDSITHPVGAEDVKSIDLAITIPTSLTQIFHPRATGITVWRKVEVNGEYRLVETVPFTNDYWVYNPDNLTYNYTIQDTNNDSAPTYEALTGISQDLINGYVHYTLAANIGGRLYVGKCWHPDMPNANTYIFRSLIDNPNTFNWPYDNINVNEEPVALRAFAGKLFVWTKTRIHTIDPNSWTIIDTTEGVSIASNNSVIVTEYGMFFVDNNNIYLHDGTRLQAIGGPVLQNVSNEKYGYQELYKSTLASGVSPQVFYHGLQTSLGVTLCDENGNGKILSFHLINKRWDLFDTVKPMTVRTTTKGDVLISDGLFLWNHRKDLSVKFTGHNRRKWRWDSKEITMGADTQHKVFTGINLVGTPTLTNISGTSSDNLRVYVDDVQKTLIFQNKKYSTTDIGITGDGVYSGLINTVDDIAKIGYKGDFLKVGMYIKSSSTSSTEILKITNIEKGADMVPVQTYNLATVDKIQMGTTTGWIAGDSHNIYVVSPRFKLPAGSKGTRLKIILDEQDGHIDSIGLIYKTKGIK